MRTCRINLIPVQDQCGRGRGGTILILVVKRCRCINHFWHTGPVSSRTDTNGDFMLVVPSFRWRSNVPHRAWASCEHVSRHAYCTKSKSLKKMRQEDSARRRRWLHGFFRQRQASPWTRAGAIFCATRYSAAPLPPNTSSMALPAPPVNIAAVEMSLASFNDSDPWSWSFLRVGVMRHRIWNTPAIS